MDIFLKKCWYSICFVLGRGTSPDQQILGWCFLKESPNTGWWLSDHIGHNSACMLTFETWNLNVTCHSSHLPHFADLLEVSWNLLFQLSLGLGNSFPKTSDQLGVEFIGIHLGYSDVSRAQQKEGWSLQHYVLGYVRPPCLWSNGSFLSHHQFAHLKTNWLFLYNGLC